MVFDVAIFRDWVIAVAGIIGIIIMLAFLIVSLILLTKVITLINKVKKLANQVEKTIQSPYYQIASWVGGMCAGMGKGAQKNN